MNGRHPPRGSQSPHLLFSPAPKAGRFANRPYGMPDERAPGSIATEEEAIAAFEIKQPLLLLSGLTPPRG